VQQLIREIRYGDMIIDLAHDTHVLINADNPEVHA